ncbi:MAG: putative metal-binding motif-containing protein, partial [Candidatus Thiodiazotropha sp. (ex Dulcina madagascariensis)]|nr:putative metal-binding motif-containing protein [Candidatus Thiodiazotropha sp. (ex Dulcina madagascariensis)]
MKTFQYLLIPGMFLMMFGCHGGSEESSDSNCDMDQDGYGVECSGTLGSGDCNDDDANVFPEARELDDGTDRDCDGDALELGLFDVDGDGFTSAWGSQGNPLPDCNDNDATAYPGALEVCDDDLEACGGVIDAGCNQDGDGYCAPAMQVVGSPAICNAESGGA